MKEYGLKQSTLTYGAKHGLFPAEQNVSNAPWLIDDETPGFRSWLSGHKQDQNRVGRRKKKTPSVC
jgi:hypothetical protein